MSGPLPGPLRPFTDDPKSNVLLFGLLGCTFAFMALILMAPGGWRWLAAVPVVLGSWLLVVIARRFKQVDPDLNP